MISMPMVSIIFFSPCLVMRVRSPSIRSAHKKRLGRPYSGTVKYDQEGNDQTPPPLPAMNDVQGRDALLPHETPKAIRQEGAFFISTSPKFRGRSSEERQTKAQSIIFQTIGLTSLWALTGQPSSQSPNSWTRQSVRPRGSSSNICLRPSQTAFPQSDIA